MGVLVCIGISKQCPAFLEVCLPRSIDRRNTAPSKMTFPVGPEYFVARGVRFMGTSTGTLKDTREALDYVHRGEVRTIIAEKTLAEIPECLNVLEKGDAVGRFVVRME